MVAVVDSMQAPQGLGKALRLACMAAGLWLGLGVTAQAETLRDALAAAYLINPTLKAKQAELRAIDEEVPRAESGYRPRVTATIEHGVEDINVNPDPTGKQSATLWPRTYSITGRQPIFRGFRTYNAIKGAQARVEAGREDLRRTEQQVFLAATSAYMDVVRDEAIVRLRENNVNVLAQQLKATQDRFEVGEVTKTDVAQATARHSGAVSALSTARAALGSSQGGYERIIGHRPIQLKDPGPPTRLLPSSLEQALQCGEQENPAILVALFLERAQEHIIKQFKGELLPEVNLEATYTKQYDPSSGIEELDRTTVTGRVTVPIYQAGEVSARIRQAYDTRSQRRFQIDESRKQVRSDIVAAWSQLSSARARTISDQAQVDANRIALSGVREEEKVGQRTVLDVLDAEQELINAEVNATGTRRDLVVASYSVLSSVGRLTAAEIDLAVEYYDPGQHYREVKRKWYGWSTAVEAVEPEVAPVTDPGLAPGQKHGDGPAYTQRPPRHLH